MLKWRVGAECERRPETVPVHRFSSHLIFCKMRSTPEALLACIPAIKWVCVCVRSTSNGTPAISTVRL